jgi:hypothetical protein
MLKRGSLFILIFSAFMLSVFTFSLVSAENLNLKITGTINNYTSDVYIKTNSDSVSGIDAYDLEIPSSPDSYSQLYSVVSSTSLSVDSFTDLPRSVNLVFHTDASQTGTAEFSWPLLTGSYASTFVYYGTDSSYSTQVASVDMRTSSSYSASMSGQNVYAKLIITSYTAPVTIVQTTVSGGGGGTTVQQYTLKVVSPGDVTLPEEGIIEVPVILQNPGQISLRGIHLSANVSFNNLISKDVTINLAETTIDEIVAGESKTLTIRITANTKKQGIYKVTIYANVDEPKFSDWGEFYIEFKKTSESDVDNAIISAEETIKENSECIELQELVNNAKTLLEERKFTQSAEKIQEFNDACEKAIYQKSPLKGIVRSIDYSILLYVAIASVIAVAIGIGFYILKRYKFRKKYK